MENIFKKLTNYLKPSEKRNTAIAAVQIVDTPQPIFTKWSIQNAVKEGYKRNSSVYRSVYLKAKAGSSVTWYVVDKDGNELDNHHLTQLLKNPNPFISRQDLFELVISWLELSGNSYLLKLLAGGKTSELWPVSPDRLRPVPTKDPAKWMAGYALDRSRTVTYEPEEIVHHKYFNPANPLMGISPLEAVSKIVDVDNAQVSFNQSTSQNRGVIDGVFTFDRTFNDQSETDAIADKLNERYRGKRSFGVLGSNAKYVRTALTPTELDFINSRKSNREEIFIAFGVPPVYAGVMEAATMNNYRTSELVFWFGTMLFLLDDIKDTFNFSFRDELKPGEKIVYDVSKVPAIREALIAKAKTAKELFDMGVPFEQLNKVFEFGFEEFEGWEDTHVSTGQSQELKNDSQVRSKKKMIFLETRASFDTEKEIEKQTDVYVPVFADFLKTQREAIFDLIGDGETITVTNAQIEKTIKGTESLFKEIMTESYIKIARRFSTQFDIEKRSADSIQATVEEYLRKESIILYEISEINSTTVGKIILQTMSALEGGASCNDLQQALIDCGIFDEKRALMLARTITGTAANLGQFSGAKDVGATEKTWITAGFEVRKSHKKMDGATVGINEYFTVGGEKAMFPLDNRLSPKERVNCRCSMRYAIDSDFIKEVDSVLTKDEYNILAKKFRDSLTKKEKDAIDAYTGFEYADINGELRENDGKLGYIENTKVRNQIREIDNALEKGIKLDKDVTIYRGIEDVDISELEIGQKLKDYGYMSASADEKLAEKFSGEGYTIEIKIKQGTKIAPVSSEDSNALEIILPRNTTNSVTYLEVTEIDLETNTVKAILM